MENKSQAIKRIWKDYNELLNKPQKGISILMPNEQNCYQFIVNIKILSGIYEGITLHLLLEVCSGYPTRAPRMWIYTGQNFYGKYHHHVYQDQPHNRFCIDILSEAVMNAQAANSGWSPAYTFTTLLLQIQNFLADPDLPTSHLPTKEQILQLRDQLSKFSRKIIHNGIEYTHTVNKPYPPFPLLDNDNKQNQNQTVPKQESPINNDLEALKYKLSCYFTKMNYIDNPELSYGYPANVVVDRFKRVSITPVCEFLSYEGYISQQENSLGQAKSAFGSYYNMWIPVYINENHYKKNKYLINKALCNLKYGAQVQSTFKPSIIVDVMPLLMNKIIVGMMTGAVHQSEAMMEAYVHYLRLFLRLLKDYPEARELLYKKVTKFEKKIENRTKTVSGDLGEMIILSVINNSLINNQNMMIYIFEELFARQILWITKDYQSDINNINSLQDFSPVKYLFDKSKYSFQILMFNFQASQMFIQQSFIKKLDSGYSVLSEQDAQAFIEKTKQLKKNVVNYETLFQKTGLDKMGAKDALIFFFQGIKTNNWQKYTQNQVSLLFVYEQIPEKYNKNQYTENLKNLFQLKKNNLQITNIKLTGNLKDWSLFFDAYCISHLNFTPISALEQPEIKQARVSDQKETNQNNVEIMVEKASEKKIEDSTEQLKFIIFGEGLKNKDIQFVQNFLVSKCSMNQNSIQNIQIIDQQVIVNVESFEKYQQIEAVFKQRELHTKQVYIKLKPFNEESELPIIQQKTYNHKQPLTIEELYKNYPEEQSIQFMFTGEGTNTKDEKFVKSFLIDKCTLKESDLSSIQKITEGITVTILNKNLLKKVIDCSRERKLFDKQVYIKIFWNQEFILIDS